VPSVDTAAHNFSDADPLADAISSPHVDTVTYAVTHAITYAITHAITHAITYAITHAITYVVTHTVTHRRAFRDSDARIGGHRSGGLGRFLVTARFRHGWHPLLH
jgi:hypothetical protein